MLFLVELLIALYVPGESFIRHSLGDFLVVILLYCLVKSFFEVDDLKLAIGILIFAFAVEFAQYFQIVDVLGIQNRALRIIIGTSFSVGDLLMYTLGCVFAYLVDVKWLKRASTH